MAKVTNHSSNPVVLPDGTFLPIGEEVDVKDWAKIKDHALTASMVEADLLKVGAAKTDTAKTESDKK